MPNQHIKKHLLSLFLLVFIAFSCTQKQVPLALTFEDEKTENNQQEELKNVEKERVYYSETEIRHEDYIYKSNIQTVLLYKTGWELAPPLIKLNSTESVTLRFDDLDTEFKDYRYTLIHCNSNWEPSSLTQMDYVTGFSYDMISESENSFNTFIPFIHYSVNIPNENMGITKSGNYVLKVYEDNDEENIVLTKRFMVHEAKVNIEMRIKPSSIVTERRYKQEVDFRIEHPTYPISNPYSDLNVVIMQNNRWDNACLGLQPIYVRDKELIFDYDEENNFLGGNEYRFFDTKSIKHYTQRIDSIQLLRNNQIEVYLQRDYPRPYANYIFYNDINGKFLIKNDDGFDNHTEGNYTNVHFTLPYSPAINSGSLYLFGGISNYKLRKDCLMKYDYAKKAYTTNLMLKQGYYNYAYVFVSNDSPKGDISFIEGTHFDTENDYTILVYHYNITDNFDRLIGVKNTNTLRQ